MSNPYFRFKQFTVFQDRCAMKVGTDGVLLGAWCGLEGVASVLDIGTGTGLIALMAAQRSSAEVVGVELDTEAAAQAVENVVRSPWRNRVSIVCSAIQAYASSSGRRFDRVVSNPPYFVASQKSPVAGRSMARHADVLPYDELVSAVLALMAPEGRFSVIIPTLDYPRLEGIALEKGLHCVRRTDVHSTPMSPSKRVLAEFSFLERACVCDRLVLEREDHTRSEAYSHLTSEFYLDK